MTIGRRDFILLLGATAATPIAVSAQQESKKTHRIAVLTAPSTDDPLARSLIAALEDGLEALGLRNGRDIELVFRGGSADPHQLAANAKDLVALLPKIIVVASTPGVAALLRQTSSISIVFVNVADPQGSGFVESIERPGGIVTGFTNFELSMAGKWLQLIKEIAPITQRALALYDPGTRPSADYLKVATAAAPSIKLELELAPVSNAPDIERAIGVFARQEHGALVVLPDVVTVANRRLIIGLADKHRLPAVYGFSFFASDGGLLSYGPNSHDNFRRAADYVARILKGERPADLPVQQPTKFELVINLKTAKALGLDVPSTLLARADEVIE